MPLASRIFEKRTRTNEIQRIFEKRILVFYKIVLRRKFAYKQLKNVFCYKIWHTPPYLYLRVRLSTFMYVVIVFMRKYTHICPQSLQTQIKFDCH